MSSVAPVSVSIHTTRPGIADTGKAGSTITPNLPVCDNADWARPS